SPVAHQAAVFGEVAHHLGADREERVERGLRTRADDAVTDPASLGVAKPLAKHAVLRRFALPALPCCISPQRPPVASVQCLQLEKRLVRAGVITPARLMNSHFFLLLVREL